MRCTFYDWVSQSDQHMAHAREHWPMTADICSRVSDRGQFLQVVRSLNLAHRTVLKRERDEWFSQHGYSWKRLGCPREVRLNQRSFSMTAPVVGASSVFDEDYGEDFDDMTGTSSGDMPPMWQDYPDDPTLPTGYNRCYNPSVQGMPVTVDVPTNQPGWKVDHYVGADDELYYFYHSEWSDSFWACPAPGSASSHKKEEVKQIQRALSKRGINPGPIDGIWGPKTCSAAYTYSFDVKGYADPTLDESFFEALDLGGRGFGARYGRACDNWFTGELGGEPVPIVIDDPEPPHHEVIPTAPVRPDLRPVANKAGVGWILGILAAGTIMGTAWVNRKKKKGRRK